MAAAWALSRSHSNLHLAALPEPRVGRLSRHETRVRALKKTPGQGTPAMGLPSGHVSICWAWREDRWEKQMVNRQWGGSVPPGGRRRLGMALSCCQSNGDYVEHAHTHICHLKNELAFGPPVGFWAGQWGGGKKKMPAWRDFQCREVLPLLPVKWRLRGQRPDSP